MVRPKTSTKSLRSEMNGSLHRYSSQLQHYPKPMSLSNVIYQQYVTISITYSSYNIIDVSTCTWGSWKLTQITHTSNNTRYVKLTMYRHRQACLRSTNLIMRLDRWKPFKTQESMDSIYLLIFIWQRRIYIEQIWVYRVRRI